MRMFVLPHCLKPFSIIHCVHVPVHVHVLYIYMLAVTASLVWLTNYLLAVGACQVLSLMKGFAFYYLNLYMYVMARSKSILLQDTSLGDGA